jgi:hypothetical protein
VGHRTHGQEEFAWFFSESIGSMNISLYEFSK